MAPLSARPSASLNPAGLNRAGLDSAGLDMVRRRLRDALAAAGISLKEASRAIGRNDAYLQQFLFRGSPRRLPEAFCAGFEIEWWKLREASRKTKPDSSGHAKPNPKQARTPHLVDLADASSTVLPGVLQQA